MGLQRCFFWHLDIRILNAYLLYQKKIKSKLSLLQYRTIIMKYLSQVGTEEQPGNSDSSSVRSLKQDTTIKAILVNNSVHQLLRVGSRSLCILCKQKKPAIKHKVNSKCKQCNIFLCRKTCFEKHLSKG